SGNYKGQRFGICNGRRRGQSSLFSPTQRNPKTQTPNPKKIPNPNFQRDLTGSWIGIWSLGFGISFLIEKSEDPDAAFGLHSPSFDAQKSGGGFGHHDGLRHTCRNKAESTGR